MAYDDMRDLVVLKTDGRTVRAYSPELQELASVAILPNGDGPDVALLDAARDALIDALDAISGLAAGYSLKNGDTVHVKNWGETPFIVKDLVGRREDNGKWAIFVQVDQAHTAEPVTLSGAVPADDVTPVRE